MITKPVIPIFRIFDDIKAKEFYVEFLGFKIDFEHQFEESFPLYIQISKDNWVIHLSEHHGDCCPGSAVMLECTGIKEYQNFLLDKKYKYSRPGIESREWGTLEMTIIDPFGNRLTFFEKIQD